MAPRTLVAGSAGCRQIGLLGLQGLLLVACFVDQPRDGAGGSSGTAASETSTGPVPGSSTGETATQGGMEATGTGEPPPGTTTGDATTTTATTAPVTTDPGDPTMGSICAPADGFPNIDPAECRACMAMNCCASVSECAADPACSGAWSCTQNQQCLSEWQNCPGYADQGSRLGTIAACAESACPGVCAFGPCPAEKAACQQSPECQAVDACVQASCNDPCPADQPDCILPCWGMCQAQHPGGADQWGALIMCYGSKCP
jgi:hypothetical protein